MGVGPIEAEITTMGFSYKEVGDESLTPKDLCFGNIHLARKLLRETTAENFDPSRKRTLEFLLECAMSFHYRLIDRADNDDPSSA